MQSHPVVEITGPDGSTLLVVVDRRVDVGRACRGVLVDDDRLSRRHLALWPEPSGLAVGDLGSRNGTMIDGEPLQGSGWLRLGQTARAGDTSIRLSEVVATHPDRIPQASGHGAHSNRQTIADPVAGSADVVVRADAPSAHRPSMIETIAGRVEERVSMEDLAPLPGGTVTFLFADMEGSTERAARLGDTGWFNVLTRYGSVFERTVSAQGGKVVDSHGDGYMVRFSSATAAAACAVELQRVLPTVDAADPIRVRIGLHTGEAIEADGRMIGLHVHIAARVGDAAAGGQVLVSAVTRAIVETSGLVRFGAPREAEFKGVPGIQAVSELIWASTTTASE